MATTVSNMTKDELRELIESTVEAAIEQKLLELLGDPDQGLDIRKKVIDRLKRQQAAVAAGERGQPLDELVRTFDAE